MRRKLELDFKPSSKSDPRTPRDASADRYLPPSWVRIALRCRARQKDVAEAVAWFELLRDLDAADGAVKPREG